MCGWLRNAIAVVCWSSCGSTTRNIQCVHARQDEPDVGTSLNTCISPCGSSRRQANIHMQNDRFLPRGGGPHPMHFATL